MAAAAAPEPERVRAVRADSASTDPGQPSGKGGGALLKRALSGLRLSVLSSSSLGSAGNASVDSGGAREGSDKGGPPPHQCTQDLRVRGGESFYEGCPECHWFSLFQAQREAQQAQRAPSPPDAGAGNRAHAFHGSTGLFSQPWTRYVFETPSPLSSSSALELPSPSTALDSPPRLWDEAARRQQQQFKKLPQRSVSCPLPRPPPPLVLSRNAAPAPAPGSAHDGSMHDGSAHSSAHGSAQPQHDGCTDDEWQSEAGTPRGEAPAPDYTLAQLNASLEAGVTELSPLGRIELPVARALAAALASDECRLKTLTLKNNSLGPAGTAAIGEALARNRTLTSLSIVRNEAGPEGALSLGLALASNETLQYLNLLGNDVRPQGARALAMALRKSNRTLRELTLWGNGIDAEGAHVLAAALESNDALTKLNVLNNDIGAHGARSLASAVRNNNALQRLYFERELIAEVERAALDNLLMSNRFTAGILD